MPIFKSVSTVGLSTLPIDATAAADYEVYTNHLVEFGPGVRSVNVPVGITDDRVTELNETFRVVLSGPSGNSQLCNTITEAVVTIVDNDHQCSISRPSFSALESQGTLEVTVICEKRLTEGTSIGLSAQGITALDGSDYHLRNTWVIFDGTSLTGTFIFDIFDDAILEDAETFRLHLLNGDGVNIGDSNEAIVSLIDNDASFSLELPSYSFSEDGSTQTMNIVVDRDGYLQQTGSVWIRSRIEDTDNAQPADASDFIAINQEVNFEPGDVEKQVQINLIDDNIREALIESFLVELYNPTNGVIVDPDTAEVFIYDDDVSEAEQRFFYLGNDKYEVLESEGDVQVTVLRTDAQYAGSVILSTGYFSTPGDARASEDYVQLNEKLEFSPGETSKTATVQIIGDDNVIEGPKKFHVDLFFPLGGKIGTPESAIINIIDDDVTLSFVDTRYATLEGVGVLNIPVRRAGYMGPISVDAIVSSDNPGSAEEGVDYYAPDTITFGQGESEVFLRITIVDDDIDEATTESFNLELVAPSNGQVVEPSMTSGVIFDNDEEDETDGSGNSLGSTAIVFIGLGAGFGLLALVALVAGVCICMRISNANRLSRSRQYLAPAPRPYELTPAVAPPYEQRGGPYYLR
ncbi:FRAS1-related extracellular matrix protein 2-like [Amphiura filiformis]|uniref:FRAS1-related extracellular matrix protein 2-like n=1 Tax=Amphiura filiformis TaxID=82378 RepID=UPI003B21A752